MKVKDNYRADLHIRFKQTEYDEIRKIAKREIVPMAEVVRRAVKYYTEKARTSDG